MPAPTPDPAPSLPIVFLHMPKAAGSTLNHLLNRQFPPGTVFQHDTDEGPNQGAISKRSRSELEGYRLLRGHIPLEWVRRLWPQDSPPCFTLLREPVARVLSHYRYARRMPGNTLHDAARQSLEAFLNTHDMQLDNLQVRLLSGHPPWSVPRGACPESWLEDARRVLTEELAVVGTSERFEVFLVQLEQRFGWRFGPYRSVNVTTAAEYEDVDPALLERIRRENLLDAALHACAAELQRAAIARFPPRLRTRLLWITWRQRAIRLLWPGARHG